MTDDNHLAWFHRLSLDDRVHLLRDPHGSLPGHLIQRLALRTGADNPGVYAAYWPATGSPTTGFHLLPSEASKIEAQREQLEWWWKRVSDADRAFLIEHRAEELPGQYAELVSNASSTGPNPALVVAMVRDNRTGSFRLPRMVDVFVEMQERERASQA